MAPKMLRVGPIIDPPPPWAPEAEQRAFLADLLTQDQHAATIQSAIERVRRQLQERDWEHPMNKLADQDQSAQPAAQPPKGG